MGKSKDLNDFEKGQIIAFSTMNLSKTEIARRVKRDRTTISKFLNNKHNSNGRIGAGRKSKLSPRQKREIFRLATNSYMTPGAIKNNLELPVHKRTIRRVLVSNENAKYCKRKKQPALKKVHYEQRRLWARNHQTWDDKWNTVVFSDEKKFNLDGPDGFQFYWHDLRKEPECCSKRICGGGSIMIWAGFGYNGKTGLGFINQRMNSERYINLLETHLLPFGPIIGGNNWIFQQDNAACHASRETRSWFAERNITVLDWPSLSPDLNPIENLWGMMARKVYEGGRQFTNVAELKKVITEVWENFDQEILQKLVRSMIDRVFSVIEHKGGLIDY